MIIGMPFSEAKFSELKISLEKEGLVCVAFDASTFNENWSGKIEYRFSTPKAKLFLERIRSGNR